MDEGELRRAAFGDRPEAVVHAAANEGPPLWRWLAAVVLGGQGRYAAAATVLAGLRHSPDPVLASLAASTLASHHRQLGDHGTARGLDGVAVRALAGVEPTAGDPDGVDAAGAWSDALLGLAADAVGLGRVGEARRLHAAATERSEPAGRRGLIRLGWRGAEIELAAGDPDRAVTSAEAAVAHSERGPGVRHRVKSDLVLAAALTTGGTPDGRSLARTLLKRSISESLVRGMFPLAWPSALMLAELEPKQGDHHTKIAIDSLTRVFSWSDGRSQQVATRSTWVPTALVRSGEPTRTGAGRSS